MTSARARALAMALGLLLASAPVAAQMFDDFALPPSGATGASGVPPWIVADFDAAKPALKDGTPFVARKGATVTAESEARIRHEGKGQSMKVSYQVAGDADAMLAVDLKGLDASNRRSLSLQMFGAREGSPAEIEIVVETAAGVGKVRVKGPSPYFWARQSVTFEQLGLQDASKVTALVLVVPRDAKPAKGAFYVDKIAFE